MRRLLFIAAIGVLVASALLYSLREPLQRAAIEVLTADMFVSPTQGQRAIGPVPGSRFPGLRAWQGQREVTLLEPFMGPNGLLLVASRSLDWCPYCRKEAVQLQAHLAEFTAAGIALVAISYDSPAVLVEFARTEGVSFPLLSDQEGLSFRTLGILNEAHPPGDPHHGIPHPGMILVAADGTVAGRLFLEPYSKRVAATAALAWARESLGI